MERALKTIRDTAIVCVMTLIALLAIMPIDANADTLDVFYLNGKLDGYTYSFELDESYGEDDSDAITVRGANKLSVGDSGINLVNEFTVDENDIVIKGNKATIDFSKYYTEEMRESGGSAIFVVKYKCAGIDDPTGEGYEDYVCFVPIKITDNVNTAPTKDTTFKYEIDSAYGLALEDADMKELIKVLGYRSDANLDSYIANKSQYLKKNDAAKSAFSLAEDSVVLPKGQKTYTGNLIVSARISGLLEECRNCTDNAATANNGASIFTLDLDISKLNALMDMMDDEKREDITEEDITETAEYLGQFIEMANDIPLLINVRETGNDGDYTDSKTNLGITLSPVADFLTNENSKASDIKLDELLQNLLDGDGNIDPSKILGVIGYGKAGSADGMIEKFNYAVKNTFISNEKKNISSSSILNGTDLAINSNATAQKAINKDLGDDADKNIDEDASKFKPYEDPTTPLEYATKGYGKGDTSLSDVYLWSTVVKDGQRYFNLKFTCMQDYMDFIGKLNGPLELGYIGKYEGVEIVEIDESVEPVLTTASPSLLTSDEDTMEYRSVWSSEAGDTVNEEFAKAVKLAATDALDSYKADVAATTDVEFNHEKYIDTGDSTQLMIYVILGILTLAGIGSVLLLKKHN